MEVGVEASGDGSTCISIAALLEDEVLMCATCDFLCFSKEDTLPLRGVCMATLHAVDTIARETVVSTIGEVAIELVSSTQLAYRHTIKRRHQLHYRIPLAPLTHPRHSPPTTRD
mmetsp:Transcript_30637/g.81482  ORF Transcript_30637/g.81482 Transcript_30637/m.81482 type:complete len:114 (-) Transcript_30637:265-606(-)